jgi:Na+-driven multidrug efflux pump
MVGHMNTWKSKTPRERRIIITYLVISLPFMLAGMVVSAVGYARIFSIGQDDPLSMLHAVGLLLTMIVALVVGLAVGGWVWVLFARFILGFSRADIEGMAASGPQINVASRYNSWCLDTIFGPRKNQK